MAVIDPYDWSGREAKLAAIRERRRRMLHDCPVCGLEDSIETQGSTELQGDPPMTGYVTFVEIVDQRCGCDLTPVEEDAIVDAHEDDDGEFPF